MRCQFYLEFLGSSQFARSSLGILIHSDLALSCSSSNQIPEEILIRIIGPVADIFDLLDGRKLRLVMEHLDWPSMNHFNRVGSRALRIMIRLCSVEICLYSMITEHSLHLQMMKIISLLISWRDSLRATAFLHSPGGSWQAIQSFLYSTVYSARKSWEWTSVCRNSEFQLRMLVYKHQSLKQWPYQRSHFNYGEKISLFWLKS